MGRMYVLSGSIPSFTGPKTILEIGALANTILRIHRITLTQATSETDDSSHVTFGRYTASGTGDNVVSQVSPADPGDAAFGGTAEDDHSVDITTGADLYGQEGISLLAGYQKIFTPEERLKIPGGGFFGLNIIIAITAVTLIYEVAFEEIG